MAKQKPTVNIEEELERINLKWDQHEVQRNAYALPKEIVGVYFLLEQDEVVYVGQSINVIGRVMQHFISPMHFDRYAYIELEAPLLNEAEWYYIGKFQPKHNSSYRMATSEYLTLDAVDQYASGESEQEALAEYIRTHYPAVQGKYYSRALFRHVANVLRKERHERLWGHNRKPPTPKQDE